MIVNSSKPYGGVKGMLKKWKKIGIVSCNSCARACETGGRDKADELAVKLRQDGFEVVDVELLPMACNVDAAKKSEYKGDLLVVLACDSGAYTLQSLFPYKTIIPAQNTIGLGARDTQGDFFIIKRF